MSVTSPPHTRRDDLVLLLFGEAVAEVRMSVDVLTEAHTRLSELRGEYALFNNVYKATVARMRVPAQERKLQEDAEAFQSETLFDPQVYAELDTRMKELDSTKQELLQLQRQDQAMFRDIEAKAREDEAQYSARLKACEARFDLLTQTMGYLLALDINEPIHESLRVLSAHSPRTGTTNKWWQFSRKQRRSEDMFKAAAGAAPNAFWAATVARRDTIDQVHRDVVNTLRTDKDAAKDALLTIARARVQKWSHDAMWSSRTLLRFAKNVDAIVAGPTEKSEQENRHRANKEARSLYAALLAPTGADYPPPNDTVGRAAAYANHRTFRVALTDIVAAASALHAALRGRTRVRLPRQGVAPTRAAAIPQEEFNDWDYGMDGVHGSHAKQREQSIPHFVTLQTSAGTAERHRILIPYTSPETDIDNMSPDEWCIQLRRFAPVLLRGCITGYQGHQLDCVDPLFPVATVHQHKYMAMYPQQDDPGSDAYTEDVREASSVFEAACTQLCGAFKEALCGNTAYMRAFLNPGWWQVASDQARTAAAASVRYSKNGTLAQIDADAAAESRLDDRAMLSYFCADTGPLAQMLHAQLPGALAAHRAEVVRKRAYERFIRQYVAHPPEIHDRSTTWTVTGPDGIPVRLRNDARTRDGRLLDDDDNDGDAEPTDLSLLSPEDRAEIQTQEIHATAALAFLAPSADLVAASASVQKRIRKLVRASYALPLPGYPVAAVTAAQFTALVATATVNVIDGTYLAPVETGPMTTDAMWLYQYQWPDISRAWARYLGTSKRQDDSNPALDALFERFFDRAGLGRQKQLATSSLAHLHDRTAALHITNAEETWPRQRSQKQRRLKHEANNASGSITADTGAKGTQQDALPTHAYLTTTALHSDTALLSVNPAAIDLRHCDRYALLEHVRYHVDTLQSIAEEKIIVTVNAKAVGFAHLAPRFWVALHAGLAPHYHRIQVVKIRHANAFTTAVASLVSTITGGMPVPVEFVR